MNRLLVTAVSMAVGIAVMVGGAKLQFGDAATNEALPEYLIRRALLSPVRRKRPRRPLVAWMGDSTIARNGSVAPYLRFLEENLESSMPIETYDRSQPGFDQYVHYMEVGEILKLKPAAIVVTVTMRLLTPMGAGAGVLQLASMIPTRELPRAIFLPWHARSITVPRLLLARAMDRPEVTDLVFFLDGLRKIFRDELHSVKPEFSYYDGMMAITGSLRQFDTPISARSPTVQMLNATVDMAVRHGVPTAVVVGPMPIEALEEAGTYGPRVRERIEILRQVVEASGGRFLDLHDALESYEFRDHTGHYNLVGTKHMAQIMKPVIVDLLTPNDSTAGAPAGHRP